MAPSPEFQAYKRTYDRVRWRIKRKSVPVLDLVFGAWRERVDLEVLDQSNHRLCVLGQLSGNYWRSVRELSGLTRNEDLFNWTVQFGFDVDDGESYVALTRAWQSEMRGQTRT